MSGGDNMVNMITARINSGLKVGFICKKLGITYGCLYQYEHGWIKVPKEKQEILKELYKRNDIEF